MADEVTGCTRCGAQLGVGRFCINCGHPVGEPPAVTNDDLNDDWRTGTAERPVVPPPPSEPPPVHGTTPAARYPLYAEEPTTSPDTAEHAAYATGSHRAVVADRRGSTWLVWVVGGLLLVLLAGGGALLMFGGDDESGATAADPTSPAGNATQEPSPEPSEAEPSEEPSEEPSDEPDDENPDAKPANVARFATATVPDTAPPSTDGSGNAVRYEARNMLDGVATTTWRMAGDGTGETLIFDLEEPTTISEVGLINGYAKTGDGGQDWYAGNRRVLAVEWLFDDGTLVRQDLTETRDLQTVEVGDLTTESVQLRLVTVSKPGPGRASRDYTALSEVALVGVPA